MVIRDAILTSSVFNEHPLEGSWAIQPTFVEHIPSSGELDAIQFPDMLGLYNDILAAQADVDQSILRSMQASWWLDFDYQTLARLYEQMKTPAIGQLMFLSAMNQFMYAEAFAYRERYGRAGVPDVPSSVVGHLLLNAPLLWWSRAEQERLTMMISQLVREWYIDQWYAAVYNAMTLMLDGKFQDAYDQVRSRQEPLARTLAKQINQAITTWASYPDAPLTYMRWLQALAALESWWYKLAQRMAVRIVAQDPAYILPLQILAYSHFVMNEWRLAREYFLQLFSRDANARSIYSFFLGIASYWQGNMTDALIYLKQANIPEYENDRLQYLLLAYQTIGDQTNTMRTFESLMMLPNLTVIHFRLFFDYIFYDDFAAGEPFDQFNRHVVPTLAIVERCFRVLDPADQHVCLYGQAWLALARANILQAGTILKDLVAAYPYAYVYRAVGDRYVAQSDFQNAKIAYVRALVLTANRAQQDLTKKKLFSLFPFLSQ